MSRTTKTFKIAGWLVVVVCALLASIAVPLYLGNQASHRVSPAEQCKMGTHKNHQVTIRNNKVTPEHTGAPLCDTLTITNLDNETRLMAFGEHDHHQTYDGVGQKLLNKGQSLQITLVKAGIFRFHDHIHDEVQGTFTVQS